ncbi:hypothetical protein [Microbacterium jejuense]|uniref:hypothetical protein n=1 Tax=Microbacterium jejuense TaxID=1263637 RepID=UPI0031EDD353
MTAIEPDVIVLDETILDDTAECSYGDGPAEWVAGCKTCGHSILWCKSHHDNKMAAIEAGVRGWYCSKCKSEQPDWHDQFFTYPI